jgi:hypothetical protein
MNIATKHTTRRAAGSLLKLFLPDDLARRDVGDFATPFLTPICVQMFGHLRLELAADISKGITPQFGIA